MSSHRGLGSRPQMPALLSGLMRRPKKGGGPKVAEAPPVIKLKSPREIGLMRDAAKEAGRNPDAIELTAMAPAKVDAIKAVQDIGVTRVVFGPPGSDPAKLRAGLERIANDVIAKI